MGSAIGYKLIKEDVAIPVIKEQINGNSTYGAVIIVRKDSAINDISELANKIFAFVDLYTSDWFIEFRITPLSIKKNPLFYIAVIFIPTITITVGSFLQKFSFQYLSKNILCKTDNSIRY